MKEWKKQIWLKTLVILLFAGNIALLLLSGSAFFYMGTRGIMIRVRQRKK